MTSLNTQVANADSKSIEEYVAPQGEALEQMIAEFKRRNLYNKYTLAELENWLKVDLYEAIDLESYRDKDIPHYMIDYCVKRKVPLYHPSNNQGRNEAFFIIKKAEQILKSYTLRKVYDSAYLDETIPSDEECYKILEIMEGCTKEGDDAYITALHLFFDLFAPVFERNGIFGEIKPVPQITDSPAVFYKYWAEFKSNRVYDDPDDVFNQSGSTRRYNAQKNKDECLKRKKADIVRIQQLVHLAHKNDPRIIIAKKNKNPETAKWTDDEIKSLKKFNMLFGKSKTKIQDITKKLNALYVGKRTNAEIKNKLESLPKKK